MFKRDNKITGQVLACVSHIEQVSVLSVACVLQAAQPKEQAMKYQAIVNGQPVCDPTSDHAQAHAGMWKALAPHIIATVLEGKPRPTGAIKHILDCRD